MNAAQIETAIKTLNATKHIPVVSASPKRVKRLAKEAADVLGYETLLSAVGSGILQHVLEMLEIEVLDKSAVFKYQKKFGRPILDPSKSNKVASRAPSGFLVDSDDPDMDIDHEEGNFRSGGWSAGDIWQRTGIKQYTQEIPEFVLNKAVQIKRELPEVSVFVEHLVEQPDPFLVVVLEGEEFYVEVWAEPGFEGRMERKL